MNLVDMIKIENVSVEIVETTRKKKKEKKYARRKSKLFINFQRHIEK